MISRSPTDTQGTGQVVVRCRKVETHLSAIYAKIQVTQRSVAGVLDAIRQSRVSISYMPDGPRLDLRARASGSTTEMGATLARTGDQAIAVAVDVERGAGWTLRVVANGRPAYETPITESSATHTCTIRATRYVRAELVGDAPREPLPPDVPADLDLRDWRWAVSNPVYLS